MKSIDIKSLIICALLTSTIFLGVAAVPKDTGQPTSSDSPNRWDEKQYWSVMSLVDLVDKQGGSTGYEPFAVYRGNDLTASTRGREFYYRKRIK